MPRIVYSTHPVLFISPQNEEHAALRQIFNESPWVLQSSFTRRDGIDLLRRNPPAIRVVICEDCLPDGDWKDLLTEVDKAPVRVNLIVSSRLADERLWAEALNLGAFDFLLGNPFEPEEVLRVTESAWRASTADHSRDEVRHTNRVRTPRAAHDTGYRLIARNGVEPLCQINAGTAERSSQDASPSGEAQ